MTFIKPQLHILQAPYIREGLDTSNVRAKNKTNIYNLDENESIRMAYKVYNSSRNIIFLMCEDNG